MKEIKNNDDKALKLLLFLKAFNEQKLRKRKTYKELLWMSDIPKEKECYSIIDDLDSENIKFDKWIEIKKPKSKHHPPCPEKLNPWVRKSSLDKWIEEPQLLQYIIADSSIHKNNENDMKQIFLKDCPEITEAFEHYINKDWRPWAKEEKRLKPIWDIYDRLYKFYKKNKDQGEIYQVVFGIGFLLAKKENGNNVRKHIVTAPVSIHFDPITGTITVGPCNDNVELSLELEMFSSSEKPDISDRVHSQLSDFENNFWINEEFDNCLKSWLNSYNSKGQFFKNFNKEISDGLYPSLYLSPAIILRKRNEQSFLKFYNEAIKDRELEKDLPPCLKDMVHNNILEQRKTQSGSQSLKQKHYFPLLVNDEQEKIIKKISSYNQIVVQGPPGTGKTHTIANLICHFLATNQKVLVTSQTEQALKVLKDKLPEKVKSLCIEILGKDQKALKELESSFQKIYSEYQMREQEKMKIKINKLETKDDDLKGQIVKIERKLYNIKKFETKEYNGIYSGKPKDIAEHLKRDEEKYGWIKEEFPINNYNKECPISNRKALQFLDFIERLKNIEDATLEEKIDFLEEIPDFQQFEETINKEIEAQEVIEQYADYSEETANSPYNNFQDNDFCQLYDFLSDLFLQVECLSNREEKWLKKALKDILANRNQLWLDLYEDTNQILNEKKEVFFKSERIKITSSKPPDIYRNDPQSYIFYLSDQFFKRFPSANSIRSWGIFCAKEIRDIKKIKIDGKKISSYEEAKKLRTWVEANRLTRKLYAQWNHLDLDSVSEDLKKFSEGNSFGQIHSVFKNLCGHLEECLSMHKSLEDINKLLNKYHVPQPQWTIESIKKEKGILEIIKAKNSLRIIEKDFQKILSFLSIYKDQKNQIAGHFISAFKDRKLEEYKKAKKLSDDWKIKQKEFAQIYEIKDQLKNDKFYLKIRQNMKDAELSKLWKKRLSVFEEAWNWFKMDLWLKEQTDEKYSKRLHREKKDILERQKQNMEELVAEKAWNCCLSGLEDTHIRSLKGWVQAIKKLGKGTGKTAPKNRKIAKKRMEECKTAIPAWVMPLYRVVENIKPGAELFDITIIDEASQTGPDGFLLNFLAKKIIVVGDKEQISPAMIGVTEADSEALKQKYLSDIPSSTYIGREYSYYDYYDTVLTQSHIQLREHFRCMPEIISFSNKISYSGTPLIPLRQYGSSRLPPLKTTFIDDAISKVGDSPHPQNEKETQAILIQLEKCITDQEYKDKTFGIISLQGQAQIQLIEDALSKRIDKSDTEKRMIRVGDAYDFQGDERDVIFLSMVVSNDYTFRALTGEQDRKRYNVAASRAKDQLWLFHSVQPEELSPFDLRRQLLSHCKGNSEQQTCWSRDELQSLDKKIKETKNKEPNNAPEPFGSWFEAKVFYEIAMRGYQVTPQYEVSGYFIDMIIIGAKGRLAVECDGPHHEEQEQQEKDITRQSQLERCGWTFFRIKGSVFYRHPEEALNSLWQTLDKMEIYPLNS